LITYIDHRISSVLPFEALKMVPNTSSSSCFRFIILVSVVLSSVVVIADMSTTTAAVLPPYVTLNVSSPRPPPFNVTAAPATATMVPPPPPPGFHQAETQADGNSAYVAERTVYPYANLAGNATLALMRFPFNRSLALATYNTLLPTTTPTTPAQSTANANAALPQSVEVLASSPSDFVIHDVSVDTDTDTVYLATAGGIFSYVDNYRHALQHLPEGWPTGLVTAVAGLVRVTLLGVNLFAANNVQTDPLHTPFQNEAVAAVVYDASVLAVTVKGLPCTSLSVTDTRPAGLPGYVATVTCTVVQPAAVDVGSLRGRDVVLTVANKGSARYIPALQNVCRHRSSPFVCCVCAVVRKRTSSRTPRLPPWTPRGSPPAGDLFWCPRRGPRNRFPRRWWWSAAPPLLLPPPPFPRPGGPSGCTGPTSM